MSKNKLSTEPDPITDYKAWVLLHADSLQNKVKTRGSTYLAMKQLLLTTNYGNTSCGVFKGGGVQN